ncbi:MAG: hypothetical protein K2X82_11090 [Gemmataceae bacterium]|nr:hypothetical protein [Gemmataceae bacterium]
MDAGVADRRRPESGEDATRTFTFTGGTWTLAKDGAAYSTGTVRMVDPAADPRAFDLVVRTDGGEVVFTSVYHIDGDTLRYCTGPGRPAGVESKPGDNSMSSVWKRKKP